MHTSINTSQKNQRGVTLLETLIALAIFSIGILGMTSIQTQILMLSNDQTQRDIAIFSTQALIEQISVNKSPAALAQYAADINKLTGFTLCANAPAKICADSHDGTNKTNAATNCSVVEMASYNSWQTLCDGNNSPSQVLPNFGANLSCDSDPCLAGDNITLVMQWTSRIATSDPRLSGTTTIVNSNGDAFNPGTAAATVNASDEYYVQVFRP